MYPMVKEPALVGPAANVTHTHTKDDRISVFTYYPGYNEHLHPREAGGFHPEQLFCIICAGFIRKEFGAFKSVSCVHD